MDSQIGLENLLLARDALAALEVRHFLIDATLLGLTRNSSFIAWDNDIDIGVLAEDFTVLSFARYASIMRRMGFDRFRLFGVWGKNFSIHWYRNSTLVDICFYFRRADQRIAYMFDGPDLRDIIEISYPARLIETLAPADFYQHSFMVPKDKEAVLAHQYGDWQVPKRDWNWRTSPLHITARTRMPMGDKLRSRLSTIILRVLLRAVRVG